MAFGSTEQVKRLITDAQKGEFRGISAEAWRIATETYHRNRPLICSGATSGKWAHPWKHSVTWDADLEQWTASIRAGFVNARPAEVNRQEVTEEGAKLPIASKTWRNIGPDGPSTGVAGDGLNKTVAFEGVPEFFKALGVGDPPSASFDAFGAQAQEASTDQQEAAGERKLLRAVDLVLTQDRPAAVTQITQEGQNIEFGITYASAPGARDNPYITANPSFQAQEATQESASDLAAGVADEPFDRLHLSTVYLVSPRGAALASLPDETWTAYVKHRIFWNLNHAKNRLADSENFEPLTFPLPLASGIGEGFAAGTLAQINNNFDLILSYLESRRLDGVFWSI